MVDLNRAPAYTAAAVNTAQSIDEGSGLAALAATDPDGDPVAYSLVSGTLPPNITLNQNGSFSGTATYSAAGSYSVNIQVSDGRGGTAITTLIITVRDVVLSLPTGALYGRVLTEAGSTVADIGVVVINGIGQVVATTRTDANGHYQFQGLLVGTVTVASTSQPNQLASAQVQIREGIPAAQDLILPVGANLTLTANPATIVGDGVSKATLGAQLTYPDGTPVSGASVRFTAAEGQLSTSSATTGTGGLAQVILTAPAIESVVERTAYVDVQVRDEVRGIFADARVAITFAPASIQGIVTDAGGRPVAGATVEIHEDFNGDGVTDFGGSAVTGADGRYSIIVPRGSWHYRVVISAPVKVGDQTVMLRSVQSGQVGSLQGTGETITAARTVGGQLFVTSKAGGAPQTPMNALTGGTAVQGQILTASGQALDQRLTVNADGSFEAADLPPGEYQLLFQLVALTGERLAGLRMAVSVSQEGQMALQAGLIDPYGIVSDAVTGDPVPGVNMQLYWADTPLNSSHGRVPDTLVNLPILPDFDPNQNRVPQITTADGEYAWNVFPDGDYYIIGDRDGYHRYDSRVEGRSVPAGPGEDSWVLNGIIHVGETIVEYNLQMQPITSGVPGAPGDQPAGPQPGSAPLLPKPERPLEGSHQRYILGYPDGTFGPERPITRAEVATILTRVLGLSTADPGQGLFPDVDAQSWYVANIAAATRAGIMQGYPDGSFMPDAPITRAEVATVAVRLRGFSPAAGEAFLDAVGHWSAGYLTTAKTEGLITGYPDGTFRPNRSMSRAEFVTLMNRLLNRGPLLGRPAPRWADVPASHWAHGDVEEASTNHRFRAGPNSTEEWIEDLQ